MKPSHPHEEWYPDDYELCRLLKIYPDALGAFMWQAGVCINLGDWGTGNEELEARFGKWADEHFDCEFAEIEIESTDPKWQEWKKRGFSLAQEVRNIIPDEYTIFYYPFKDEKYEIKKAQGEP